MNRFLSIAAGAALSLASNPAAAQTSATDRIGAILGQIFGGRSVSANATLDAQWSAGRTPLSDQRGQFYSQVNAEVQAGRLSQSDAQRVQSDYDALVQTEARYGADGRFDSQERADLSARYSALTQVVANRGYASGNNGGYTYGYPGTGANNGTNNGTYNGQSGSYDAGNTTPEVANGRAAFEARVNAAVSARRITRVQGTRLKADYYALVRSESEYLRDGVVTEAERGDIDTRLDSLDTRLDGGVAAQVVLSPRARLDAITQALPSSGLSVAAKTQLRVEQQDLMRLEAAYARLTVSADERAYLDRRIAELEVRARVRSY